MMLHSVVIMALAGLVTADFDPELHAKYLNMSKSSFIEYFNAQNYSWKMAKYENIDEKFIACAQFDNESIGKLPIQTHDLEALNLPENFDARDVWKNCGTIRDVYDQGECGSCWTFGTATTISDRMCIHKGIQVSLSEQDFECLQDRVCTGGYPLDAFEFWKSYGLVTLECKPYDIEELSKSQCVLKCVNSDIDYFKDKHYGEKVYKISSDIDQIKAELVKNGPVQAGLEVFSDFFEYEKGIYVHTHGERRGGHSVRVIGYGVENGIEYWLAVNSWGPYWGENGLFKIKTNQEDIEFEKEMVAGIPKD